MNAWPVLIIGAGKIGRAIAALLTASGDYRVTIADRDAVALAAVARAGVKTVSVDVSDEDALVDVAKKHKAILSAAPFFLTQTIAQAARRAGGQAPNISTLPRMSSRQRP